MSNSPLDEYSLDSLTEVKNLFDENDYAAYDLVLLLTENRPGIHISLGYEDYRVLHNQTIQQVLDSLDLPYQLLIKNQCLYHDQTGATAPFIPDGPESSLDDHELERDYIAEITYHVAHTPERFITHDPSIEACFPKFLGYPEPDIKAYHSKDYPLLESVPLTTHIENGKIDPGDALYTALTRYSPAHTLAGIERAIEIGKSHYESCKHYDGYCGTNVATTYADTLMNMLHEDLSKQ